MKEPIIVIVGFLGAGKTTLLKRLVERYASSGWDPFVILNDYENANLDAQQLTDQIDPKLIQALNGSCICCSGIAELRESVNDIPPRSKGITLIEANGTSDACSLMGFLGVGIEDRFLPPVQISVVDVKNWQKRREHNELESNQVQVSSLIVLTHTDGVPNERIGDVKYSLLQLNPKAKIIMSNRLDVDLIAALNPSYNTPEKLDHLKAHWASCSVELPRLSTEDSINELCANLPMSLLRVKGVTKVGTQSHFTYFERTPDGTVAIRPFKGEPTTGPMLLSVGPGSTPELLLEALEKVI